VPEQAAAPALPTDRPRPELRPVVGAFVIIGLFVGSWAVSIPEVERALGGGPGLLGVALTVSLGLAAVVNAGGGVLAERLGTSRAMSLTLGVFAAVAVGGSLAPAPVGLFLAVVLAFAALGPVDVVANVAATAALADQPGRLTRVHAMFNGGAAVGAAVAGGLLFLLGAWSWRLAWAAVAVLAVALAAAVRNRVLPAGHPGEHVGFAEGIRILRRERLLPVAVAFALGALVEGGVTTWGVLQLREQVDAGVLVGATSSMLGFTIACLVRLASGRIATRRGARLVLVVGTSVSAVGLLVLALVPVTAVAAAGLVLAAGGISVSWPLLMSEIGRGRPRPGALVGALSSVGYIGLVIGPGLIGLVAGWFGLPVGILLLALSAGAFPVVLGLHWRSTARLSG
jgi:MFS family permease